jgi:broad specificity phosphatase PhoE
LERPPGGESQTELTARVMAGIHAWVGAEGVLLVVTHGGVIHTVGTALGQTWLGNGNLGGAWVEPGPAAGRRVHLPGGDERAATTTVL